MFFVEEWCPCRNSWLCLLEEPLGPSERLLPRIEAGVTAVDVEEALDDLLAAFKGNDEKLMLAHMKVYETALSLSSWPEFVQNPSNQIVYAASKGLGHFIFLMDYAIAFQLGSNWMIHRHKRNPGKL